jgi:flagellar biogenesis protein FliO
LRVNSPGGGAVGDGRNRQAENREKPMIDSYSSTFLFCAMLFALSFVTIGAFWLFERLRGANVPHL